jgi:pimeloyl-ACP methyl ester carboxylesterase
MLDHSRHRCETIRLSDGRRLAFTLTGPADGRPVIYCHGAIGTPVDATVDLRELTAALGILYIAPSRPGVGGSDPLPGRRVYDFADDIRELADRLALQRFAVTGVSAGGPYALAVAHRLRERVTRVGVCSSLSPLCAPHRTPGLRRRMRMPLAALAHAPQLTCRVGDALLPLVARHPELVTRVIAMHAASGERARLDSASERAAAAHSFLDACCGGVGGLVDDYLTYASGWGFEPSEIETEVQLWHGGADPLVPVEHALQLAAELPHCHVFVDPDEGHHFFRARLGMILEALIAAPRPARAGRAAA